MSLRVARFEWKPVVADADQAPEDKPTCLPKGTRPVLIGGKQYIAVVYESAQEAAEREAGQESSTPKQTEEVMVHSLWQSAVQDLESRVTRIDQATYDLGDLLGQLERFTGVGDAPEIRKRVAQSAQRMADLGRKFQWAIALATEIGK